MILGNLAILISLVGGGVPTTSHAIVVDYNYDDLMSYTDTEAGSDEVEEVVVDETVEEETSAIDAFFEEWFSAEQITQYVSWFTFLSTIVIFMYKFLKERKLNNISFEKFAEIVQENVQKAVDEKVPAIIETVEEQKEILNIFAKIIALSQENTAENKLAILELIQQLGSVGSNQIDKIKDYINTKVEEASAKKEELNEQLDEIIEKYDGTQV